MYVLFGGCLVSCSHGLSLCASSISPHRCCCIPVLTNCVVSDLSDISRTSSRACACKIKITMHVVLGYTARRSLWDFSVTVSKKIKTSVKLDID